MQHYDDEQSRAPARDLADPTHTRHSLRASLDRRVRHARRQRVTSGGRRAVIAATSLLALGAAGATAHDRTMARSSDRPAAAGQSAVDLRAIQRKLGVSADGIMGPRTRAAIKRFQRRNGLTVDGIVGPQTLAALGLSRQRPAEKPKVAAAPRATTGRARDAEDTPAADAERVERYRAQLDRIAQCESGGDPKAVSADGRYRGKYQFLRETWEAVGGQGDPVDASEAEQDTRAAMLMERQGPSAWPHCSKS